MPPPNGNSTSPMLSKSYMEAHGLPTHQRYVSWIVSYVLFSRRLADTNGWAESSVQSPAPRWMQAALAMHAWAASALALGCLPLAASKQVSWCSTNLPCV